MAAVVEEAGESLFCLIDGFPLGSPVAALFDLAEPGFDERLVLGVAVAPTPVGDTSCLQVPVEVP